DASCEATLLLQAIGSDNCSNYSITSSTTDFTFGTGNHQITWTIVDDAGNNNACLANITVLDTIAPIITCESLITDTIFDQSTSLFMAVQVPIVDDNCSFSFSNSYNNTTDASDMYNVGSHQVLWTATDASGNESTCVTTVEVISNFAPFIICPNDTIVYSSATGCDVNVQLPLPLTNLANPINDYNGGHDASDIYPLGSTTIMCSADDINNITHTCQVSVTVVDTIAPIVVCPNDTILELIAGQCDIEYTPVIPQQIDNCNIMSSGWDVATANYVPGNYAITFTSTDESGNSSVCQQNIQVVDLIIPSIDCPNDTTVYLTDASCEATLLLQAIGSDNCSNYSITSSTTDFTFGTGNHQITWTIVDDAGNSNACLANITVLDTIAPMIWCESTVNDTLYFNELNTFLTIPSPQVSDNCTVSYSNDYNNSTDASGFYSEGFYPVTWTAIDASGNTATCITEVNVVTSTEEILICPTDTIVYVTSLECGAHINISLPLTNISNYTNNYNGSIDASGYYPVGEYQVQWSGLNNENTLLTCSTSVTVLDTISPVINCPDEIIIQTESGENMAYIIPETPFTSDNCAIDSISNSLFQMNSTGISLGLGSYNMAWTVVDIHGNVSSCLSVIHVVDTIQPEILCIDTIAQFVDNGLCSAQVLVNQPEITNSELNLTITNDLGMNNGEYYEFPTGITTMTWTVTDINNNTSTCSTVCIITDNLAPIVYCEDTITAYVTDQECVTWVELETPEFFENCTHSSTTNSYNGAFSASDFYPHGETDINWFVSDINGNLGMCTTTIQVIDTVAPELFCPDTLAISLLLGESYHVPDFSELVLPTDTCNYVINYWQEIAEGTLIQADTTILFFAQDQAGNTTECSIVIEIEYPNTPIIPDCPDIISFFADTDCHIVVTDHTSDISSLLPPNSNYTVHQSPEPGVYSAVTEIQFWITDINGLTSDTCSTPVQVIDNTPPVLVNATDAILYLDSNCESIIPDFSEWISYEDACGNVVVYSQNPTAGTVIQGIQTINATYWMMDEEGNTTTLPYLFDIIVLDTISPVMLPLNPMVIYQTEDCQYNMPDIASTAISLSCDEVTISQSQPAGVFTPTPNFTGITILATDESGNETSQFVSIQLADTIAPVISVLDDVVIPQDPGMCGAQLDLLSLIEISDCDDLVAITLSEDNGGIYSIGEHDISYYAVDGSGNQSATHTVHITVQDTEAPTFISVNDTTICQLPFTQPIYVNDCGNLIQVQDNNPTLIVGTNLLQFTYSDGTHTIDYSYQVIVQEMPEIVWTTLSDSICQEATEMEIQVSGPDNYVIYMDDIGLDQNIIHFNELSSGMHTIEVQAEHLGCTAQVSQTFEIVDAPLIDILSDTLAICGEAVQMEVMSTDDQYIWSIPSSMNVISHGQNEFELATTAYGEFEVLVQLTIAGCTTVDSVIVIYDEPVATPFAGDDQEIYLTSSSLVESAEISVGQAHWFAPDNQIYFEDSTLQSTTVYGLSLGQNEIILFVENGTCSASDTLIINVGGLFIPSGYSPNGDGKNDQFIIKGIENIAESSLIIVNRWGQSVYSAVRYNNDWDGRDSGGEALPDDTYFYELSLDGEKHHGYVVLKR
ncbi:MAG: HYR domain-containing protein, partial [Flavobacteriales bacterium]|nr:HYR domain-containing protein [Flavobacteriales bacterium]